MLPTSHLGDRHRYRRLARVGGIIRNGRPGLEMLRNAINNRRKRNRRPETGERLQLLKRRYSAQHILETWLVGLIVWHIFQLGGAFRSLFHKVRQTLNGNFAVGSDVDDLADGALVGRET